MRPVHLLVLGLTLVPVSTCAQDRGTRTWNGDALRADLDVFLQELRAHPSPFHMVDEKEFQAEVARVRARLARLGPEAGVVELVRLAARIGDGHTRIAPPDSHGWLPLEIEWIEGSWFVVRAVDSLQSLVSSRVVAWGGLAIDAAYSVVSELVPAGESEGWARAVAAAYLTNVAVLRGLGLADAAGVHVRVASTQDRETDRLLNGVPRAEGAVWPDRGTPFTRTAAMRRPALAWNRPGDGRTVYVAWNAYLIGQPRRAFQDMVAALFRFIDDVAPDRLVLDLRWNVGGDFTRGRQIVREIERRPPLMRPGALYVLIGRRTFSAAMVNAVDLHRAAGAILVGEPTGARPNSYSEARRFRLPATGLQGSVAACRYELWPEDVPGVPPDVSIPPTSADLRRRADAALEWILRQPVPSGAPVRRESRLTPPCERGR